MPLPPVNANVPNPVPVPPNVGGPQGPVPPAPGANPPVAQPLEIDGPQPPVNTAAQLVSKLDSLLVRAAKTATSSVDAHALDAAAGAAKLDELAREELSALATRARMSFAALAGFTGRQIAAALVAGEKGAFDWKEEDPVAAAIKRALDDQAALAEKLHGLVNKSGLPAGAFDALCELALQCDRRGTEIVTLAMELADACEQGGDDAADARLDKRLDSLLPRQALSMHGTKDDLGRIQASLRPLVDRLDAFAARGPASITGEELAAYTREIQETANALARAGREGIPVGEGGSRTMPDRQLLDAAAAVLRGLQERLAGLRGEVARAAATKHVERVFASIRRAPVVGDPARIAALAPQAPTLAVAAKLRHQLLELAEQYVRTPTPELKATMSAAMDALKELPLNTMKKEIGAINGKPPVALVTFDEWKAAFAELANPKGLPSQIAHLVAIMDSAAGPLPPEKFLTAASAKALFEGELQVTTLVEARIRGIDDADVDPALDPSRATNVEKLGSGQVNTVYLTTFSDGSKYVFKPETAGRQEIETLHLAMDYKPETQVAHLNIATAHAARHFGLEDVMVKTTVGTLNGQYGDLKLDAQYGIFMEKAPGETCATFTASDEKKPGFLTAKEIRNLPDDQYAKVLGRIIRQTNRLEWFDMLTGQGDRHSRNYMIQVKEDLTVIVKCIDNDACYPAYRTGLRKVVLDAERTKKFNTLCDNIVKAYPEDLRARVRREIAKDPGIKSLDGGRKEIDPSLFRRGELHWAFRKCTGSDCDVLPEYIDEDLYDRFLEMEPGSAAREAYRQDLLARLPADAVESAMLRLDEAIALAKRYKEEGKVVSAEDFEKREVQKNLLRRELFAPDSPIKPVGTFDLKDAKSPIAQDICKESRFQVHGLLAGDLIRYIGRKNWFR